MNKQTTTVSTRLFYFDTYGWLKLKIFKAYDDGSVELIFEQAVNKD